MPNIIDSQPGPEYLYGTDDADVFRYLSLDDSRVGASDGIIGFQSGVDKLDISAVDGGLVQIIHEDPSGYGGYGSAYTVVNFGQGQNGAPADTVTFLGSIDLSDIIFGAGTGIYLDGGHSSRVLQGTDYNDIIHGGNSTAFQFSVVNTIIGGLGADMLYASAPAYTEFEYNTVDDSRVGSEDHIFGFGNPYLARINLSQVAGSLMLFDYRESSVSFAVDSQGVFRDRLYVSALGGQTTYDSSPRAMGFILPATVAYEMIASDSGDALTGEDQNDVLAGGPGSDTLTGGKGADTLTGGPGADRFVFATGDTPTGAGDFIRDFQTGLDSVDLTSLSAGALVLLYTVNNYSFLFFDLQPGGGFSQEIIAHGEITRDDIFPYDLIFLTLGTAGADTLVGGDGQNRIQGFGGADYLQSGGTSTTFVYTAASDSTPSAPDYIDGFRHGADHIDLSQAPGSAVILAYSGDASFVGYAPDASGAPQGIIGVGAHLTAADLVLSASVGLVAILGSDASEGLPGTAGVDYINGGGGDDFIAGGGGADGLVGGPGADTFQYFAVTDSTPTANDYIADFEHGADKIDLRGVAGTELDIHHDGAGNSVLLYDFLGETPGGEIVVHGDVEAADVYVDSFTDVVVSGAFAALPTGLARDQALPHTAFASGHGLLA